MPRFFPSSALLPVAGKVLDGLVTTKLTRLRLERLPRGADGMRIDVLLGAPLSKASRLLVGALVRETAHKIWRESTPPISDTIVGNFRTLLQEHHDTAVRAARDGRRIEHVQLFQTALIKLLLESIDQELESLRRELDDVRDQPVRRANGQSMQLHHRAALLGRHAGHVRFQAARRVLREVMQLEHSSLKKQRNSVLGVSWPVAETMLSNPVLQLCGGGALRDFARAYPAVLYDEVCARRINRCVMETLRAWLPDTVEPKPGESSTQESLRQTGGEYGIADTVQRLRGLVGESELNDVAPMWIDVPDNAAMLLGGVEKDWPTPGAWHDDGADRLQRALNRQLATRLSRAGLIKDVQASYEFSAVYPWLGLVDAETMVFDYLKGAMTGRELQRRLASNDAVANPAAVMRRIDELRRQHRKDPLFGKRQNLARIAADVLRLRRDLKQALRFMQAMGTLRLVTDPGDIELALANNSLQQFCATGKMPDAGRSVIGHVVIHVDIRGAGEIAARMRQQHLNPAAHFSRLLYDPLNRLLKRFDAEKAVVEGDALTLSILEFTGGDGESVAVARACCVATRLLDQLELLNNEFARMDLRSLEVGIGIAYADEPPTYLYDHSRRVMLSPAIGPAKRMAGCHSGMRRDCPLPSGQRLCVATPVHGDGGDEADGDTLVRYNVNGTELDAAAFAQLNVEIPLRKLKIQGKRSGREVILHAGYCTDTRGESHLLLIREHPVKLWVGRQLLQAEDQGRRYYEVVADSDMLTRVEQRLAAAGKRRAQTASGVRNLHVQLPEQ